MQITRHDTHRCCRIQRLGGFRCFYFKPKHAKKQPLDIDRYWKNNHKMRIVTKCGLLRIVNEVLRRGNSHSPLVRKCRLYSSFSSSAV